MEEPNSGPDRQFHLFDQAMRSWAESNPAGVAAWLDPSVSDLPAKAFVLHSSALNDPVLKAPVMHADVVIGVGPERVMHVEYETSPRPNLVHRMYDYRGRIMRQHRGRRVTQHVIVLKDGQVKGHDDLATHGFALALNPVYLRRHDPAEYLTDPFLAPFAALAGGSREVREISLRAAIRLIRGSSHPSSWVWLLTAISIAEARLDRSTIDRIEKEEEMSVDPYVERFRDHRWGRALIQQGLEEGLEQGLEQGRRQGEAQGRMQGQAQGAVQGGERVLLALLRTRFGDSPEATAAARLLAGWDDVEAAVAAINAATEPGSLLNQPPPASFP